MIGAMSPWLRALLGLTAGAAEGLDRARFFLGGAGASIVIAVMCAAAAWFGFTYYRDGSRPRWHLKGLMWMLRMVAVAALCLMLMQPMLRFSRIERQRYGVVVLVDNSLSMALRDPRLSSVRSEAVRVGAGLDGRSAARSDVADALLRGKRAALVTSLSKRFDVRLVEFATDARTVRPSSAGGSKTPVWPKLKPDETRGNATQLGNALRTVLDETAGQPIAGMLVVSDGGSNLGDDPTVWAQQSRKQGIPVSTVGIGDPTPTRDVALTEVLADQVVRKGNTVRVYAGIQHRGYDGSGVTVTLSRGGSVVQSRSVTLGPTGRKQTVSFQFAAGQPGSFAYTVRVGGLGGEVTAGNNSRRFLQQVVTKRLKILYIESDPRWEYRYLKNAVLRDQQIEFGCLLTSSTAKPGGEGNIAVRRIPVDEGEWFAYDIVILGDVARAQLGDLQLRNLRRFVEDKGGSLIVMAGEAHMPHEYAGTVLEPVLPVAFTATPDQVTTDEPFPWEITPEGRQDPLLRMDESAAESDRIWSELPGMFWMAGVTRARPGATVLAVNPMRANANGKRVLLAVQPFGAGKCLFSAVDSTWRWRWKVGDRYFYRYWGQAIRSMTPHENPGGNRFAQVNADRGEYLLGGRTTITARLLDRFYRPAQATKAMATIKGSVGGSRTIALNAVAGSPGIFQAEILADRVGEFTVSTSSPAAPGAPATARYIVQSIALEQQQPEMNEALLRKTALAGGGKYYDAAQVRAWPGSLKAKTIEMRNESETDLWDAPGLLALFVVPLLLEWFIRKRSGLV